MRRSTRGEDGVRFERLPGVNRAAAASVLPWGEETIVIHDVAACAVYGRHVAPLSLKTTIAGDERYRIDGPAQTVRPGMHLIVNDGQRYESAIEAEAPSRACACSFLRPAPRKFAVLAPVMTPRWTALQFSAGAESSPPLSNPRARR
ncbi:MAG: hypothetical protein HC850_14830 [Rhodomicrobium sp.]|nr:hypothetical protein [Rhodomicrobium sp.]